ncbi:thiamine diphosphokinase [Pseudohoeflea coraliihabitans]|uniref:Thiamine diphosphokinase n=1 Tax=Pseudohoeflea coraliihabitans TaxID=2860393 RepID=A0ABS6WKV5_9HYPH|nr:thiamine diphosphokinase [Pseudohoeflea sp. DP4N28-3]MBW3096572.1 thiamine diphosphokinase [Pseudohoeflea sp. DP4N28-3]
MTKRFAILLGGALQVDARVRALAAQCRVIAADSGIRHAAALGVQPELWLGDFDSTDAGDQAAWPNIPRRAFAAEKNATDGEIAIDEAIALGATHLRLFGAFGGERTDHAAMHLVQAVALAERGLIVVLSSGAEEAHPLSAGSQNRLAVDLPAGALFSLLPFSDLGGLTIRGARYPLVDMAIPFGSSRPISNVAEGPIELSLRSGRAIMIARPHDFSGV